MITNHNRNHNHNSSNTRLDARSEERGRLKATTFGDDSPRIDRTYTPDGLLERLSTGGAFATTWRYGYNNRRLLTTEILDMPAGNFIIGHSYDANGHPDNFYCRSDHYMYARYGIPIAFFSTGGHRDYHQVTDEAAYLDFDKLMQVSRLVAEIGRRLGDAPARPVVDGQRAASIDAPCRQ